MRLIPHKLYDIDNNYLVFDNSVMPISENDVYDLTGLPKGTHPIILLVSSNAKNNWRNQFINLGQSLPYLLFSVIKDIVFSYFF